MPETYKDNAFLILAAGKGTRMNNSLPKVLHKICGKEMISYVIELAENFSKEAIGVIVSPDAPETSDFVDKRYKNIDLIEQKERLGTGHAVKVSMDFLKKHKGNTICLYGDTPFVSKNSIEKMIKALNDSEKNAVIVLGFTPNNPAKYGRLKLDENEKLAEIVEYNDASDEERKIGLCNSGIVAINGKYTDELIEKIDNNNVKGEYYLTDIVKIANDKGLDCKVVFAEENEVMGINSQKERVEAENTGQTALRNKFLEQGVIIQAPETVFFSADTEIESDVEIEPYVTFHGKVKISKGSKIRSYSYLEDCEIGENNVIGPYARVRPGTTTEKDVKIGNFVEVKKSEIGEGSKINHLSYVGDSEIGKDVNIGAGTITCNYDGKEKHKTKVEDGVFIGSNSSLVAPVNIGKGAKIGAGTTILKDVEEGSVVINKKTQENL